MYTKVQLGRTTPDYYEVKVAWIPTRLARVGVSVVQKLGDKKKEWVVYDVYGTIGKNICLAKINNSLCRSLTPSDENWRRDMTQKHFFDTERERVANIRAWLND